VNSPLSALFRHVSWLEWLRQPWRTLTALLAVTLGVALAFSVQLINQSALSEFSAAVRSVNGQPDFEIRGQRGGFDEALYERVAAHSQVGWASPVIEIDTYAFDSQGQRVALRLLGIDALVAAPLSPALVPHLARVPTGWPCSTPARCFSMPRPSNAWVEAARCACKRPAAAPSFGCKAACRPVARRWP